MQYGPTLPCGILAAGVLIGFAVSSTGGGEVEREWTEPYDGQYRVGVFIDLDLQDDGRLAFVYSEPFASTLHPARRPGG